MSERIEYPRLLREATLGLVRRLLVRVTEEGLPGEHHFYLTFDTRAPGVELGPALASRYPETMTVVLQHQWADLAVDDAAFAVTLRFGGVWERLRVPFSALTSFLDPSVPFGLDFTQFAIAEAADAEAARSEAGGAELPVPEPVAADGDPAPSPGGDGAGHRAEILPFRPR
ncbi:MAG TPA: ClpXP protease specificity-enhancing factor SspB [Thermoanaerobaculia bacterium]|nr:ClpXP protease specificity-enhancing factor SspB [Thermoanaerobaculia bacterium]